MSQSKCILYGSVEGTSRWQLVFGLVLWVNCGQYLRFFFKLFYSSQHVRGLFSSSPFLYHFAPCYRFVKPANFSCFFCFFVVVHVLKMMTDYNIKLSKSCQNSTVLQESYTSIQKQNSHIRNVWMVLCAKRSFSDILMFLSLASVSVTNFKINFIKRKGNYRFASRICKKLVCR